MEKVKGSKYFPNALYILYCTKRERMFVNVCIYKGINIVIFYLDLCLVYPAISGPECPCGVKNEE